MIAYRREIEGLRALAILPVVVFHFSDQTLSGGFLGVDVFFVISGFLITSLILKDTENGIFSPKYFWIQRIRRIIPALSAMVFVTLIFSFMLLPKWGHVRDGWQGLSGLMSYANICMWRLDDNYWGPRSGQSLFLHCWSLSIEEQFYLFFPIIVVALRNKKHLLILFVGLCFTISLCLFVYSINFHYRAAFYLLPMRAWEIAAGSMLAITMIQGFFENFISPNLKVVLQWAGITIILLSYCLIDAKNRTPLGLIWPVIGTVLTLWSTVSSQSILVKIMSSGILNFIGKISYSIYLWHWPVICLSNQLQYEISIAIKVLIIFIFSIFSYYLIELPFRKQKYWSGFIAAVFVATLLLILFMILKNSDYDISMFEINTTDFNQYDLRLAHNSVRESNFGVNETGIIKNYTGLETKPQLMVLGDSHALMWSPLIDTIAKELKICVSFNSISGVSPFFKIPPVEELSIYSLQLKPFRQSVLENIKTWAPVVLISKRWIYISPDEPIDLMNYLHSTGAIVLLIEDPPELYFEHQDTRIQLAYRKILPVADVNRYLELTRNPLAFKNKEFPESLILFPNCSVLKTKDIFLKKNKAWVLYGKDVLYYDGDHLSTKGAFKLHDRMKEKILEALAKRSQHI